ncbi:Hsp70 family protein [Breoghania sp. JC706]|uniref:Hsp70 family protein n=1 Tax=Breoghania sp. JC706 TaxID=3117732 RepID=UPI00300B44FF
MAVCGIDFGTSNSSIGILRDGAPFVVPLDKGPASPSALFFRTDGQPLFGRAAIAAYTEGEQGRFMRALKSMLGHSALASTTMINRKRVPFSDIITHYLRYLKQAGEAAAGEELTSVVLGRPVSYVDGDPEADADAESAMETIARKAGFRDVAFVFEPVAAAEAHSGSLAPGDTVLVVDLGGGTADFSLLRQETAGAAPRILGNAGVHVGGTDIDYRLNVDFLMPLMGCGGEMEDAFRSKVLPIPKWYFLDLATWQKIPLMYDGKIRTQLREIRALALEPEKIERFIAVLDQHDGHRLAGDAEAAKIALSDLDATRVDLDYVEPGLAVDIARAAYEASAAPLIERMVASSLSLLSDLGEDPAHVDTILMTGGTSQVPQIQRGFREAYPNAAMQMEDLFATVCTGLTVKAATAFG